MARRDGLMAPQAKDSTLQTHGTDKYGRTLADVLLHDGTNVNHVLVESEECAGRDTTLVKLETEARESKRGLWADPHPVSPWVWRMQSH